MSDLVGHLERFLGPISRAWKADADGKKMPYQILAFRPEVLENTSAFTTLGLSRYPLSLGPGRGHVRLELMLLSNIDVEIERYIPPVLQQIADECLGTGSAALRGQVFGPRGRIVPKTEMELLYVTAPVYFPDEFAVHDSSETRSIIVWLVPIYSAEAEYVTENGWPAFERILEEADADLIDWQRSPIVPA